MIKYLFFDVQKMTGGGDRIVGGLEAKENSWPWIVRVQVKVGSQSYLCGGTIIDNKECVLYCQS